jgi:hypothetical protein
MRYYSNVRHPVAPIVLLTLLTLLILSGCQPGRQATQAEPVSEVALRGSCVLGLPEDLDHEATVVAVLRAEGEYLVQQDIDRLMLLWQEESQVVDAKNSPDDTSDDQLWDGIDAIRHRYVRTVFPGAPDSVQPADLDVQLDGDRATILATTRINDEISPAGDRWELVRVDGCWYLQSLTYNLESSDGD